MRVHADIHAAGKCQSAGAHDRVGIDRGVAGERDQTTIRIASADAVQSASRAGGPTGSADRKRDGANRDAAVERQSAAGQDGYTG